MKHSKSDIFTAAAFCAFLFVMMLLYLFLPKQSYSENEKRYLSQAPGFSWEALASGDLGEDIETYFADHIPGRDFFVGLNAYFELYTGRQVSWDVRLAGDRLVEAPVELDPAAIQKNMGCIRTFADTVGQQVDLMIVPSAGWAAGEEGYEDSAILEAISAAGEGLNIVDVEDVFRGREDLYYKTDHHWTSEGAFLAYRTYMRAIGREYRPAEEFTIETVSGFQGSTYSRSALWLTPGEELQLWHGSENLTVTNGESEAVHQGVFYDERLEEADKYTVYLDGNHSIVRIQNPEAEGKLLVIRDSYSNCLGCFLAQSYGEVVLADLRYYKTALSELADQEEFDNILVCYSLSNFLTDTNLVWLR